METQKLPKGTTKEQWDQYEMDLKNLNSLRDTASTLTGLLPFWNGRAADFQKHHGHPPRYGTGLRVRLTRHLPVMLLTSPATTELTTIDP